MVPTLWRYLLSQQLKILFLCVTAFIAILLTTRLDEIAHFASLGANGGLILKFTLYQIPYILPIAIPISALISSMILMQRLSQSHELTALRACGYSLRNIIIPILASASFLSICNFYIVSELATEAHLQISVLKRDLRTINPLLLLHNNHLMRMKGIYFHALDGFRYGGGAKDVILALPNKKSGRMSLLLAGNLQTLGDTFVGHKITLVSPMHQNDELMIENIEEATSEVPDIAQLLQKQVWKINDDHLRLPLLVQKINQLENEIDNKHSEERKLMRHKVSRSQSEIIRRLSLSFAVFTFTLLGLAFGMGIGRQHSKKGIFYVIILAAIYLISYFTAGHINHRHTTSTLLYLAPHGIIIFFTIRSLNRISKGVE